MQRQRRAQIRDQSERVKAPQYFADERSCSALRMRMRQTHASSITGRPQADRHGVDQRWPHSRRSVHGYTCPTVFNLDRLSARSCSAVKAFPQVLHLHLAFGITRFPTPGLSRPFSLGRNAITSSPPHSMHCRLAIVTLLPQRGCIRLVTIEHCPTLGPDNPEACGPSG